jgi:hypothetical protein
MASLNLQRNSEVYVSTVSLAAGANPSTMTPSNTWKVEVLAGFAMSSSAATQDITAMESGTNPDRSQTRFLTSVNPVEWNFQTYLRPTGASELGGAVNALNTTHTGNSKPVADWFLWQYLVSNTAPTTGTIEQSTWRASGLLASNTLAAVSNAAATKSNFSTANEFQLYFKLDNVIYQVNNAAVNQATVDAGIEEIATVTWAGNGLTITELTNSNYANAAMVFKAANANSRSATSAYSYHPFKEMNVGTGSGSVVSTNSFIKNRLSAIEFNYTDAASVTKTFTFPVTALSFDYNNNITYLSPEELNTLNSPIGQFTGTRAVSGTATMYLKQGTTESNAFLSVIANDGRTSTSINTTANLIIGGATAPYVSFYMPAVQFDFPQVATEDVIAMSVNFVAQETVADKGNGGEVTIRAKK